MKYGWSWSLRNFFHEIIPIHNVIDKMCKVYHRNHIWCLKAIGIIQSQSYAHTENFKISEILTCLRDRNGFKWSHSMISGSKCITISFFPHPNIVQHFIGSIEYWEIRTQGEKNNWTSSFAAFSCIRIRIRTIESVQWLNEKYLPLSMYETELSMCVSIFLFISAESFVLREISADSFPPYALFSAIIKYIYTFNYIW